MQLQCSGGFGVAGGNTGKADAGPVREQIGERESAAAVGVQFLLEQTDGVAGGRVGEQRDRGADEEVLRPVSPAADCQRSQLLPRSIGNVADG